MLADVEHNTSVVSLYQAGNGIYDLYDKVTVIAEGRVIYYGPRSEARAYFEGLGFVHPDGGNTADFLTSVTAVNEREITKDHQGPVPTSAADFSDEYEKSDIAKRMRAELEEHLQDTNREKETEAAQNTIQQQKSRYAPKKRPEKVDFFTQVRAALIRDYQMRWGDQWTFWARQATTFIQAWITGSLFYQIPASTGGLFLRGGTIFLTLLCESCFTALYCCADIQSRP